MGRGIRPTPEFRREPVRLTLTSGQTRRETAEDLGIGLSTMTPWLCHDRDTAAWVEASNDFCADLGTWALGIARRRSARQAKVALARRLAMAHCPSGPQRSESGTEVLLIFAGHWPHL